MISIKLTKEISLLKWEYKIIDTNNNENKNAEEY